MGLQASNEEGTNQTVTNWTGSVHVTRSKLVRRTSVKEAIRNFRGKAKHGQCVRVNDLIDPQAVPLEAS